jgi:hypothetical protein
MNGQRKSLKEFMSEEIVANRLVIFNYAMIGAMIGICIVFFIWLLALL